MEPSAVGFQLSAISFQRSALLAVGSLSSYSARLRRVEIGFGFELLLKTKDRIGFVS